MKFASSLCFFSLLLLFEIDSIAQTSVPGFTIHAEVPTNITETDPPIASHPEESLMSAFVDKGVAVHQVGSIAENILRDIGWGDDLGFGTGIEDDFELKTNYDCSGWPVAELTPNNTYYYNICYLDYEPYNAAPDHYNWRLEVSYLDESNTIQSMNLPISDFSGGESQNPNDGWYNMYVPHLPDLSVGKSWIRNIDGTLKAKLKVSASSADGEYFYTEIDVKIDCPPSIPLTEITSHSCFNATLEFYSEGATVYIIHYSTTAGAPYENEVFIPSGSHSYTFSDMSKFEDYFFRVEAVNADGESTWGPQVKKSSCCSINVAIYPNPTTQTLQISTKVLDDDSPFLDDDIRIEKVTIFKIDNPSLSRSVLGGEVQEVDIPVYDMPNGVYILQTESQECGVKTQQIIKQ